MTWLSLILWGMGSLGVLAADGLAEQRLAFVALRAGYWQLDSTDLEGQHRLALTDTPFDKRCVRGVPGTGQLLFRDNEGRLFQMVAQAGATPKPILTQVDVVKDFDLDPARGFLISTYAPNATEAIRVWWHPVEGAERRLVAAEAKLNEMPRWQADRSFVFVQAKGGHTQIHRGNVDSLKAAPLWPGLDLATTDPAPSPDGRGLAYCRESRLATDLWVSSEDGSQARLVYAGPGLEAEPCWHPEGKDLFFTSWDGKNFRIARVGLDGTRFSWVTPAGQDCRYPAVTFVKTP